MKTAEVFPFARPMPAPGEAGASTRPARRAEAAPSRARGIRPPDGGAA